MWKGYVVYEPEEAEKNQEFIRLFEREGAGVGIEFSYCPKQEYRQKEMPQMVLNRTRDRRVSAWYEERKVPVFHSSLITEAGNNKWKCCLYLLERMKGNVSSLKWMPDTLFLSEEITRKAGNTAKEFPWEEELPAICHQPDVGMMKQKVSLGKYLEAHGEKELVVKSVDGHGGNQVFLWKPGMEKSLDFPEVLQGRDCIVQECMESNSEDVRVYIIGNRIYHAMCRRGKKDFRSNFSLGGEVFSYELSIGQRWLVEQVLSCFSGEILGMAGLDFILGKDGNFYFNELEEMVGCRMLYQNTDKNIVGDYVEWLKKKMIHDKMKFIGN